MTLGINKDLREESFPLVYLIKKIARISLNAPQRCIVITLDSLNFPIMMSNRALVRFFFNKMDLLLSFIAICLEHCGI